MDNEIWKPIPGYDGYEASSIGRIRSWRGRGFAAGRLMATPLILKMTPDKDGYLHVGLRVDGVTKYRIVGRLVLEAFVGPCPEGMECRHFPDNKPANNRIDNLSWSTHLENILDKSAHGTLATGLRNGSYTKPHRRPTGARNGKYTKPERTARGDRNGATKLTVEQVQAIRRLIAGRTMKVAAIARDFGVSSTAIAYIRSGKNWKHIPHDANAFSR